MPGRIPFCSLVINFHTKKLCPYRHKVSANQWHCGMYVLAIGNSGALVSSQVARALGNRCFAALQEQSEHAVVLVRAVIFLKL